MAQEGIFSPDNLMAGGTVSTDSITIISGQVLGRGSVLGKITASGKYNLSLTAAGDGSEVPYAILADDVDASGGDIEEVAIYIRGAYNVNSLTIGTGHTAASIKPFLRDVGIDIKTAIAE